MEIINPFEVAMQNFCRLYPVRYTLANQQAYANALDQLAKMTAYSVLRKLIDPQRNTATESTKVP